MDKPTSKFYLSKSLVEPLYRVQCSTVVSHEVKSVGKTQGQGYLGKSSCVIWNKLWPDLEGEKDFNDDHKEEIIEVVQSMPGFQECNEDVENLDSMRCRTLWISNAK
ncbi:hypothetical protein TNCV_525881 [Trichonephila clavipes]|nr:hypothetical protein TNCV_525881 [Trichonephila clavipes]